MAHNGFELLDVHDQAAVAVDEQDLAIVARHRNPDCVRQVIDDRGQIDGKATEALRRKMRAEAKAESS
jgi:hypothetical protein